MLTGLLKKMSAATLLLLGCQGLLLAAMQIVSARLGKSGYGRFGLAMSFSVFASQFIQWGMDQVLTVKFARGSVAESLRLLGYLYRQKQLAALLALAIGAIVALSWNEADERLLVFLGALDGVAVAFTIPSIFDAHGSTATWQLFAFLRHSIYLGAIVLIASLYSNIAPVSIVAIHLLCTLPEVLLEQLWIRRHIGILEWPAPVRQAYELWRNAAPLALALLAQQVLFYCGVPIMRAFGREAETGGLYLSNQFSIGAASFLAVPGAILHARLALHAHEGAEFRRRVFQMTILCALVGVVVSLTFPIVTGVFVRHFFKNLADSAPAVLAIDTWRLAPILASIPLASGLICLGKLRSFSICNILAAVIGIAAAIALVPAYGTLAPAMGIVAGRLVILALFAVLFYFATTPSGMEPSA